MSTALMARRLAVLPVRGWRDYQDGRRRFTFLTPSGATFDVVTPSWLLGTHAGVAINHSLKMMSRGSLESHIVAALLGIPERDLIFVYCRWLTEEMDPGGVFRELFSEEGHGNPRLPPHAPLAVLVKMGASR